MHLTTRLLIHKCAEDEWILFNMLTGAVDVLDEKGYEQFQSIKKGDFFVLNEEFGSVLKKRGYLFEDKAEEDKLLREMIEQYKKKLSGSVIKALICPTFACNLQCTYCFQEDLRERVPTTLGYEEITLLFRALDEIVERKEAPGAQIILSGGEPLLHSTYQIVNYILKLSSERDYPVGIATNGVNLSQFIPLLEQYQGCIGNVQVTIDGPAYIHNKRRKFVSGPGTFDRIVQGVDLIVDLGIATVMRTNVDLENINFLPELAEFVRSKGWNTKENFKARLAKVENHQGIQEKDSDLFEYMLTKRIEMLRSRYPNLKNIFNDMRISHTLGQLSKMIEKDYDRYEPSFYYCEATSTGVYVFGPDGLLYPCTEAVGNPSFSMGRFVPHLEIEEEKLSVWQDQSIVKIPECNQCPIALLCGGGCRYEAMQIGEKSRMTLCDARRKQVEKYVELHMRS